ncbi:DNA repair protein RAD16 [Penicillium macrosclerotiorum]|uniref:DNA repair protein RAD16 n=1 Tax=Penicillium macrosclerotiorum TaxID=303699 RepID=UPI00254732E7|nr:DNA repair protein RAD16 [Penicillium macrosclerotiorum]KAJ5664747.1 DNA repair protein RAD16 [Penicillium macrosclerotiorum]
MRRSQRIRRSVVPDSEDDASFSGMSLRDSSPLRRARSLPKSGSTNSRTRGVPVIQDSEGEDDLDTNKLALAEGKSTASGKLAVVIPLKEDGSSSDSPSRSLGIQSTEGTTGCNTPATSVEAAAESDIKLPRTRVNASARAQNLHLNNQPRRKSLRGTKRSAAAISTDEADREATDAALAHALQMEEYEQPVSKKPKTQRSGSRLSREILTNALLEDWSGSETDETYLSSALSDLEDMYDSDDDSDAPGNAYRRYRGAAEQLNPADYDHFIEMYEQDQAAHHEHEDLPPTWDEQRKARRMQADRKKLEKKHPTITSMWETLKATPIITPKAARQPDSITRKLKPFQLEGLSWMMEQEKTEYRGGLLGDEMGMGKTIQAVSLIMSDFPQPEPTLVLVPPVALMQWVSEIKEYTNGKLKVLVYHNSDSKVKKLTPADLRKYDVIMISYSSLESIHRKQEKGWSRSGGTVKEDSVIHSIDYHRLILDEAHSIKQRTTGVAKACFALKASYKWCLSGTPVQNRIGEFFSLLRFLQVRPFACYFCKQCDCEQLQWTSDKHGRCTCCGHTGFNHISIFNKEILNPITEGRTQQERKEGLAKLRLITDHIMLRRMKEEHTSSMELPPKRITIHNEFFGEIEHDFSRSIMTNSTRQFDTYVSRGVMLNNYANIFGLIMQMRQVANHPDLILKKHVQPGFNILVCRVCDEPAEDAIRSRCRHEFCRKCAKDYIQSFEDETTVDCPQCHIPLSIDLEQPTIEQSEESVKKNSIINRILMEDWTSSTKIETLLYELYQQRSKTHTPKSIIFSQFTSMLQLVEWRLRHAGFNTVMLDGTMTPAQRQKSIEHFMNNADVEVFLVSLKAGGVALNLTEASRVFIIDPWWNPAAEWQSADRSHRIGQQRPCVITRLTIEDSVESRIVQLQEKKANLIRGTINKDQDKALEKLTPEDMQFLFRGS